MLERGLLPPTQFYIECKKIGVHKDKKALEILLHLKNIGTYTLVATNIRIDVMYIDSRDEGLAHFTDLIRDVDRMGKLVFPHSIRKDLGITKIPLKKPMRQIAERGIPLVGYDTFVQAGIDQTYPFQIALPNSATMILVWSSFEYAQRPSSIQRLILLISRKLGLIQYSLSHIRQPHTTESMFNIE